MSAADPVPQTQAPADPKLYEPSMEEILASIRRIIADDQSLPGRLSVGEEEDRLRAILTPSEAPAASPEPEPAPTIRAIFAPHPVAPEFLVPRPAAPPAAHQPAEPPRAEPPRTEPPRTLAPRIAAPQYAMPDAPTPVVPPEEEASPSERPVGIAVEPPRAAESPLPPIQESRMSQESSHQEGGSVSSLFSATTGSSVAAAFNTLAATRLLENDDALKGLARDMLRPMLKEWLDDNLPVLVERLVRAEIERVGRGGR